MLVYSFRKCMTSWPSGRGRKQLSPKAEVRTNISAEQSDGDPAVSPTRNVIQLSTCTVTRLLNVIQLSTCIVTRFLHAIQLSTCIVTRFLNVIQPSTCIVTRFRTQDTE